MISVAEKNILLSLHAIFNEVIIDDCSEKNKISEVFAQFNIKKNRSDFQ